MRVLMVLHAPPCSPALGPARRHLHLFEEISRRHAVSITPIKAGALGDVVRTTSALLAALRRRL